MEADALTTLASGISAQAPRLCRAGLYGLLALRLGALAFGAKTLWRDEIGDLACNSTAERSCLLACFDAAFPLSPFSLYLLQMASVFTHSMACFCLFHPPDSQRKGSWWQAHLHSKSQQPNLHLVNVLARILLGDFLIIFHSLYRRYPQTLYCMPSNFFPKALMCIVGKSNWKEAFNLFASGTSWVSVMMCFIALYPALIKILPCPSRSTKTQLSHYILS